MLSLPEYAIRRNTIHHMDIFALCNALADQSVDMILCDLPYGTTACHWDTVIPFEPMWKAFKRVIKPRGAIVLTGSQPFTSALVMSNPTWFRYSWVWLKDNGTDFLNVNRKPFEAHEDIAIFYKAQPTYNPQFVNGEPYRAISGTAHRSGLQQPGVADRTLTINSGLRYPQSYQYFPSVKGKHPTQKPVALFEYLIKTYTQPGELVFDPCVGSGTTAIAARKCGRDFICGDSDKGYVEIARKRLQDSDPFQPTQHDDKHEQLSLFQTV